jgi:hypothetical protein
VVVHQGKPTHGWGTVSFELPILYHLSEFGLVFEHKKDVYSTGTGVMNSVIFSRLVYDVIVK